MIKTLFLAALFTAVVMPPPLAANTSVTDDAGRSVTIPASPKRIVVLHEPSLGVPLADIGVAPVGSYGRKDDGTSLMAVDFYTLLLGERAPKPLPKGVGAIGNMDLEKIRALKPDLILGAEFHIKKADQLSKIAPLYIQNVGANKLKPVPTADQLAKLLGKEQALAKRRAPYLKKLEQVKADLAKKTKAKTYLAVFLTDQVNVIGPMSGAALALKDLGLKPLELPGKGAISGYGSALFAPISAETFSQLNPDILVVMNSFAHKDRSAAASRAALDKVTPGWSKFMKPAKDGRIVFADSAKVTTPAVASSEYMLAALERWLAKQKVN